LFKILKIISFTILVFISKNTLVASEVDFSKVELVGTITGKHTLAIIRLKDKSEGIYQINQELLGYTIISISAKSVLLKKFDKLFTLSLIAIKNRHYYGDESDLNSKNKTTLVTYEYRINRNTFNSLHNDTQSWLDNVGMKMQIENGFFSGYEITFIKENSPAELLGLTQGDVIKGINNIMIKQNTENFIKKISTLTNAKQFTLNMKHNDTEFNLKFLIQDN